MRIRRNVKFYVHCLSRLTSEQVVFIITARLCNFFVLLRYHREGSKEPKMCWNIWTLSNFTSLCEFAEIIANNLDMHVEAV
jgi:hypothetical protein